jgi:hypothetical protein
MSVLSPPAVYFEQRFDILLHAGLVKARRCLDILKGALAAFQQPSSATCSHESVIEDAAIITYRMSAILR